MIPRTGAGDARKRVSKSKTSRTTERPVPARQHVERAAREGQRIEPHPPPRRRGLLVLSLTLLAAWIVFLVGLALFGS